MLKLANNFSLILLALAESSRDTRVKVGAIILRNNRIISTGYNGQLPKLPHEPIMCNGNDISTVHAEQNALMHFVKYGIATDGCILFVTHFPCHNCTKLAIMAGIKEIYYLYDYKNRDNPFSKIIKIQRVDTNDKK